MKKLEQTDIDKIVNRLTSTYVIEQIFLWTFEWEAQTRHMLQILMQKGGGQYFTDANIYTGSLVKEHENMDFVVCYPHEIKKKIKQGLGRALLICQPENLIYTNPERLETVSIPEIDIGKILDKTRGYIDKELHKIEAFVKGYQFYLKQEHYGHAAFMLHQIVELAFRTAEHLLVGEERRTHCLKTHQNYVGKFSYELGNLFRTPEYKKIIDKLDAAYTYVRYDQDFIIERNHLETGYLLAETMLEWLTDYSAFLIQEISEKLVLKPQLSINPTNKIDMNTPINTDHRDLILNALEKYCTSTLVSCFAYHNKSAQTVNLLDTTQQRKEVHRYYLLLLYTETTTNAHNIQTAVKNLLPENIDITLLPFEYNHFQKQCNKQQVFHRSVFQQSEHWHEDQAIKIDITQNEDSPVTNQVLQQLLWSKIHQNAQHLFNAHDEYLDDRSEEVTCYCLALSLEQACLGLIHTFWQFQPQSTNLNHLMQLCDIICPEATSVFILEHPSERDLFKLLVEAQQQFRHNTSYRTNGHYLDTLVERTRKFLDTAKNMAEMHFAEVLKEPEQTINNEESTVAKELCA